MQKAKSGFGPYVEPFEGAPDNPNSLAAALKGTKMVICCGKVRRRHSRNLPVLTYNVDLPSV